MAWTERDETVWNEIMSWEQDMLNYEGNDFQYTYSKWLEAAFESIPEETRDSVFQRLDQMLFHLHSLLQGSQVQSDARERILVSARAFHEEINEIADLKKLTIDQLHYLNNQHSARHRLYSFVQGGVTGTSGLVTMAADFPAMVIINLRSVQLTALTYGYDVHIPFEMMTSLKVFHAAFLPNRLKVKGWSDLVTDLEDRDSLYFYNGSDKLTNSAWLEEPLKQALKLTAISMFKNKKVSSIPLIGMAIGAGANYQLTRKVTQYAERYYQYRYLFEKRKEEGIGNQ
ncbi:MAG TPA: EcsC family protein [Chondromyces sp.]|nr:EcsC family protein [Chondromyces sp.]